MPTITVLPAELSIVKEKFPAIAESIEYSWGTEACLEYLKHLIIDYTGVRLGFPKEVLFALIRLHNDHPTKKHVDVKVNLF